MAFLSADSRYTQKGAELDAAGQWATVDRVPMYFADRSDNIEHVAAEGDTWDSLAEVYYSHISSRACGLWWVIAEYQPTPVVDPTLRIRNGTRVVVPAPIVVVNEVLSAVRSTYL